MKSVLPLLLTILALPAFADEEPIEPVKPLPSLEFDFDHDGTADTARILPGNAEHEVLEIHYSAANKTFRYEKLVPHFTNTTCSAIGSHELAQGPHGTVLWTISSGNMDECRSVSRTTFQIGIDFGPWAPRVEKADVYYHGWSMGGPRPIENTTYDFLGRTLEMEVEDTGERTHNKGKEELRPGCVATLAQMDAAGEAALPMCAAQQAHFMNLELYAQASKQALAVCPTFRGSYVCTRKYGDGNAYKSRVMVIYREDGKYNRYDISDHSRLWIADGRRHKMARWAGDNTFVTTTCRRETISTTEESWLKLSEGDARKPLYDRYPSSTEQITWTQNDIEGESFRYQSVTKYLNDDGSTRTSAPTTMDCVKEKDPE